MSKKNYLLVDISGKVDLYDEALYKAIKLLLPDSVVKLLIPGNGLLSLVPWKFRTSKFIVKRLIKIVESFINYTNLLVKVLLLKPNVLHLQWLPFIEFNSWEIPIIKCLKKFSPDTKLILTIHNIYPHNMNEEAKLKYNIRFRKACTHFDSIIVHTKSSKEEVINEFAIASKKIHVCCHGVFVPQKLTHYNSKVDEKLHILQFGSQSYYKGTDILVEAICSLSNDRKAKIETHIIGGIDPSFLNELKKKDTASLIKWKPYFLDDEELYQEIYKSDIIILPYRAISQSGVLLLSIYFEKLIICSNLPSFIETMRGNDGDILDEYLFFNTEDVESLKNLLEDYIDKKINTDLIYKRVKNLKDLYSWDSAAKATISVYDMNESI